MSRDIKNLGQSATAILGLNELDPDLPRLTVNHCSSICETSWHALFSSSPTKSGLDDLAAIWPVRKWCTRPVDECKAPMEKTKTLPSNSLIKLQHRRHHPTNLKFNIALTETTPGQTQMTYSHYWLKFFLHSLACSQGWLGSPNYLSKAKRAANKKS